MRLCRHKKSWPSFLNLGQLWGIIPAPEVLLGSMEASSKGHCRPSLTLLTSYQWSSIGHLPVNVQPAVLSTRDKFREPKLRNLCSKVREVEGCQEQVVPVSCCDATSHISSEKNACKCAPGSRTVWLVRAKSVRS